MSKKKANTTIGLAFIFVHVGFCASLCLMFKSEQFPVVWHSSMFMNAPNSLVLFSLILSAILVIPMHFLLKKTAKLLDNPNIIFGIYYIDCVAIFSFIFLFTQSALIINGSFDVTPSKTHIVRVMGGEETRSLRDITTYHIFVEDWQKSGSNLKISVERSGYEKIDIGDSIKIVTKKGFLGYEWIINSRQIMNGTQ